MRVTAPPPLPQEESAAQVWVFMGGREVRRGFGYRSSPHVWHRFCSANSFLGRVKIFLAHREKLAFCAREGQDGPIFRGS